MATKMPGYTSAEARRANAHTRAWNALSEVERLITARNDWAEGMAAARAEAYGARAWLRAGVRYHPVTGDDMQAVLERAARDMLACWRSLQACNRALVAGQAQEEAQS